MSITREQIADLRPGDVVELAAETVGGVAIVRGPLYPYVGSGLAISHSLVVRRSDGDPSSQFDGWSLTVVSRAPRPLYVNHPRTEPVPGDVVRDADRDHSGIWVRSRRSWVTVDGDQPEEWDRAAPDRLRLLVDGETGQVVQ